MFLLFVNITRRSFLICNNSDEHAVAYSKQWNNPRPNVTIEAIDLVYGKDKRSGACRFCRP